MEDQKTTAIQRFESPQPPPACIVLVKAKPAPLSNPLEHSPQPSATKGAIALLTIVIAVGIGLIGLGLLAIAMRPQPAPILPPPVVNPKCVAWCGK